MAFTNIYHPELYNYVQVGGSRVSNLSLNLSELRSAQMTSPIPKAAKGFKPSLFALSFMFATIAGLTGVWTGNQIYGPEMYATDGMVPAAEAFSHGQNYAVFDLNLNVRHLKDETIARLKSTPDVVILGASQWQEAHADQLPGYNMYNAHVHRDYWEDPLAVTEMLMRHNRLPKKMMIAVRDLQFTALADRKDYLWEPGIPFYRDMADRLGIEKESYLTSLPYNRVKALFSISMLFDNLTRWYNAKEYPHATTERQFDSLDALLPDGSIVWSRNHLKFFSQERALDEVLKLVEVRKNNPLNLDPAGIAAFEHLLDYLKSQGVQVYLTHPPYNPLFYDRIQGTPFAEGLAKLDALVQRWSRERDMPIIGSFNPHEVGCESSMYIDAEHSNPSCIGKVLAQFAAVDQARSKK